MGTCDQASVFHGIFLAATTAMQGRSYAEVQQKLQRDWFTLAKASWCFWAVAHTLNFALVPLHWRLIYANVMSVGWGTFLSKMMANEDDSTLLTPIDHAANAISGGAEGLPGGNATGVGIMGAAWLGVAVASPFTRAKIAWLAVGGSGVTFVAATVMGEGGRSALAPLLAGGGGGEGGDKGGPGARAREPGG